MTPRMREVLARVVRSHLSGRWFRAGHRGQRVTLAALFARGVLARRAWRGVEGDADAAHEYAMSSNLAMGFDPDKADLSKLAPGTSPVETHRRRTP